MPRANVETAATEAGNITLKLNWVFTREEENEEDTDS